MDTRGTIRSIFGARRALIGVIHVGALPGAPGSRETVDTIAKAAAADARAYRDAGFSGLMVENMHDRPYLRREVGPEVVAAMTVVAHAVRREVPGLPLGIQVLAGANRESIAIAHATGARFVRVEGFVFAHVADEGLMQSDAGSLLRYRRQLGAEAVAVFADIKKKHSAHAMTADMDIAETARAAEFFLADGVIVTGTSTGRPADRAEVEAVARAVAIPTLVGSGTTPENIGDFGGADAFIVGTSPKREGLWSNPVDPARAAALVKAFVKEEAHRVRKPVKQVVNDALRRGLTGPAGRRSRKAYRVQPHRARLLPGVDRGRLNALADELEEAAIVAKARRRRRS